MEFTTFSDMLRRTAWRLPNHPFITWVDRQRSITYAEGVMLADRAAAALANLGVSKGDRVAILAHNGLDYVVTMFAIWRLGAISAHISVQHANNLAYFLANCEPKVLVYTGDLHEQVAQAQPQTPSLQHTICYDGAPGNSLNWESLLKADLTVPDLAVSARDGAHLSYTSGSSGQPKGVVLLHGHTARATNCIAERLQLSSQDITLGPTSLASSYQLVVNLLPGVHRGCHIGVLTRWDVAHVYNDIQQRRVSVLPANPLLLTDLLHEGRTHGGLPPSLRLVLSGGAPTPYDLKKAYRDEFDIPLVENYGQSELGGFVALGYPRYELEAQARMIGRALPDKEVRVVDEAGDEVPLGEPGELIVRGGFMQGYWNMSDRTDEVVHDGWLHTGDMGYMDSEGYLAMLGRRSERIFSAGRALFPRPMEETLYCHPAVQYAVVLSKPDTKAGALPKAVVALYAGKHATSEELLAHCQTQLEVAHSPTEIEIIPEMPMTATGKVNRATLQQREYELATR